MKKIFAFTMFLLSLGAFSQLKAQDQDRAARAAQMKQKMKDDLKLTDVQADSVSAINQEFMPQRREIYMDQSLSQDDKKAKLDAISDQSNKRIQAVLGDDLFKKYQDWWQKNRPQRGGGGGSRS